MKMTLPRRIILSKDEQFTIWGCLITSLKVDSDLVNWGAMVSVRDRNGFVGSVTPSSVPEVQNALQRRNRLGN